MKRVRIEHEGSEKYRASFYSDDIVVRVDDEMVYPRTDGWIKLSEREPTEADADNEGYVVWIGEEFKAFVSLYTHTFLQPAGVHWLPLPKFQEQDKDEEQFEEAWGKCKNIPAGMLLTHEDVQTVITKKQAKDLFNSALRYERGEK